MVSISFHDFFDVDRGVLATLRIIEVRPTMVGGRLRNPAWWVFGAETREDLDPRRCGSIVDPVVGMEIPLTRRTLNIVPDEEYPGQGQTMLLHQLKMVTNALLRLRAVDKELRA